MIVHTCTRHQPGSSTCYGDCRCHCPACRLAGLRKRKLDRHLAAIGQGSRDACGARRRIQALHAVGWPLADLCARLGWLAPRMTDLLTHSATVQRGTHAAVRALYDALWDQEPAPSRATTAARRRAQKRGWPVPAAWDDGYGPHGIDNPDATPAGVEPAKPTGRDERERRIDGVRDLLAAGETPEQITARLGVDLRALTQTLRRWAPDLARPFLAAEGRMRAAA